LDEAKIFHEIEKTEIMSEDIAKDSSTVKYVGSEVTVRKKFEEPIMVRAKEEPLPEDKVREAALIYRIAENPKDLEAYREIGDYYMGIGNIRDAKEAFKMVLKLRPRDLKAKSSLREIEMKMRLGS
jgi:tetratricopeptide (TPR) repeat protein